MEMVRIDGWDFPRHPAGVGLITGNVRRLSLIQQSIEYARSQLSLSERAVHLELCRVEAKVRTLLAAAMEGERVDGDEPTWLSPSSGLANS